MNDSENTNTPLVEELGVAGLAEEGAAAAQEPFDLEAVKKSILVVEDDPDIRQMLVKVFGSKGYHVHEADDAGRAFEILESTPIGVALIDKNLPGSADGIDVLREVTRRAPLAKSLIITADASTDSAIDALRLGAFDYLRKPFKMDEVVEKIEKAFVALSLDLESQAMSKNYGALFETIPGVVWFSTENGVMRRINHLGAELLGYSPEELLGQSYEVLLPDRTNDPTVNWAFNERRTGDRSTRGLLVRLKTAHDEERAFEIFSSGVYISATVGGQQAKRFWGTVGVAYDVTEKIKLQAELLHAHKMKAIGVLAGGVAHDINNVLAVILGLGSVLEKEMGPDSPKAHDVKEILSAARRGKTLVENLLGFARKGSYEIASVSLNDVVHSVLAVLHHSVPKKIAINTTLDDQLALVACDSAQMTQTLMNLCINASDALDGLGTITISTSNETLGAGDVANLEAGHYVKLQVKDDGPGMDEETRAKAFEPFFTTKDVGKGTGLGLSMAYGVIENYGGVIQIDSSPGEGTAANIWLPVAESDGAKEAKEAKEASRLDVSKRKILFIDDEEMMRKAGKRMLEAAGYEVVVADGGNAALEIFKTTKDGFGLVLLDLSMPVMDGAECFEKLKEIDPSVRVLICTGHGSTGDTDEMIGNGALSVMRKPFDLEQLSEAIVTALSDEVGESE